MKRTGKMLAPFISSVGVLALLSYWVYKGDKTFEPMAYVILGATILLVCLSLYFKVNRFKNKRAGLSVNDEFSKRIKEKAAAKAFHFSIPMWVFGGLFLVDIPPRAKIVIGIGVLAMALFFFITWLYYSKMGVENED